MDIINFNSHIIDNNIDEDNKLSLELELLIADSNSLLNALNIYNAMEEETKDGNALLFTTYHLLIEESIITYVIMGISKLLDCNHDSRSVSKLIRCYEQEKKYMKNEDFKNKLHSCKTLIESFQSKYDFKKLRDKFFAHLDKETCFSSLRVGYQIQNVEELYKDFETIKLQLIDLHNTCSLEAYPEPPNKYVAIPHIKDLKNVEELAKSFISSHEYLKNITYIDSEGLHYKDKFQG